MRVDRITLQNFKGFERRHFDFRSNFTLMIGSNGAGKSSVLDALAVAAGAWFVGIGDADSRPIRQSEVHLRAVAHETGKVMWEQLYPSSVLAYGSLFGAPIEWARAVTQSGGRTTIGGASRVVEASRAAEKAVRAGERYVLPLISYYGTGRLWEVPKSPARVTAGRITRPKGSRPRLLGYRNAIDPRLSVRELVDWIAEQSWITFRHGGAASQAFTAIRGAIIGCVPGGKDLYFDPARGEVIIDIDGQGPRPFDQLSDGQRSFLAMVGDIARRADTLNPFLGANVLAETPGIVLIDELDLHLHPVWQRRVIDDLRRTFPKIQFVATTHSPFLVQSLRSGEELLMLEGQPTAELGNRSISEIAAAIMGVANPETSQRYDDMKKAAKRYLETVDEAAMQPAQKLAAYRKKLESIGAPYADNPAFQAFLEMKRAVKLKA